MYEEKYKLEYWIGYKNHQKFKEMVNFIEEFNDIPNFMPRKNEKSSMKFMIPKNKPKHL